MFSKHAACHHLACALGRLCLPLATPPLNSANLQSHFIAIVACLSPMIWQETNAHMPRPPPTHPPHTPVPLQPCAWTAPCGARRWPGCPTTPFMAARWPPTPVSCSQHLALPECSTVAQGPVCMSVACDGHRNVLGEWGSTALKLPPAVRPALSCCPAVFLELASAAGQLLWSAEQTRNPVVATGASFQLLLTPAGPGGCRARAPAWRQAGRQAGP